MAREIKFRAWDGKSMHFSDDNYLKWFPLRSFYEMNEFEWMQYTGLKDKNGVEIYFDSDLMIIKMTIKVYTFKEASYSETDLDGNRTFKKTISLPCILKWDKKTPYFYNKEHNVKRPIWIVSDDELKELEVIGNIHQDPELI